ncbi:MAG: FAD-dependent oxidoreductase [Desulfovibrionaceae bacterium]|nr:FAD-dependent oxidoreductase [Desulfovibrionaceae bacterium]
MQQKVVVIGGVALGPKASCRCLRLNPDTDLTLIDENNFISYGGCGLPYYVSGEIQALDALRSTNYQVVRDPDFFARMKGFQVRNNTRALAIDRKAKTVRVRDLGTGQESDLPYDKLVLATGARPRILPIPGADLQNVFTLTHLEDAQAIRQNCEQGHVTDAVIIGGGFIGLEAAVALADMWDVHVSVVEMGNYLMGQVLPSNLGLMAAHDLRQHNVQVCTGEKTLQIIGQDGKVAGVVTDKQTLKAQLVIMAAGFIPNGELAQACGLEMGPRGAIMVDEYLRSSDPDIYAGGDCAAMRNIITGKPGYLPLGSLSNRQGRIIGTNLAGGQDTFPGFVGTWCIKLFDLAIAATGLTIDHARNAGFDAISVCVEQLDRAHFYPEKEMMALEIVVEKGTRRVLGMQGASQNAQGLKARVDAVAGVLQYAKPTVLEISNLEVGYAPPFAAAMDVVNVAGNVADNVLAGRFQAISAQEFVQLWQERATNQIFFIDARPKGAGKALADKYSEWHMLPLEELPDRFREVPTDRQIAILCNTGLRSYDSLLMLAKHGVTNVVNALGGMQAIKQMGLETKLQ